MDKVTIRVDFDIARTSPNRRMGWQAKARETAAAKEAARWAWKLAGEPTLPPPVCVSLISRRPGRFDADNLLAAAKPCFDAILIKGVVSDDGPAFVRYGSVMQISTAPGERPSIAVQIVSEAEPALPLEASDEA